MRKNLILTYLCALLCVLLFSNAVWAGVDPPVLKTLDGSLNQISADSTVTVEDSKFFDAGYDNILIKPYRVQNKISFIINESANYYLQSAFSATVHLRIIYTKADGSVDSIADQPLTINYDTGATYTSRAIYVLSESAYRVTVKVLSAATTVGWNVWPSLQVVNELQSQPQYNFSCSSDAIQSINHDNLAADAEIDELPVSWANKVTADEYDLEWCYADSSSLASGKYGTPAAPTARLLFDNNATRVTITGTSYNIPLIYDNKGALFFRVRPVQVKSGDIRFEANWSSDYTAGLGRFEFNGHQRKLNWQATTSYAEEGKRKIVVQYFDGSLRGRQTVTKDNTTNTTIVAETKYDYQGRPVIQVLPTPTLSNVIKYSRNFNVGLNGAEYDKDNFDKLLDPALYCNTGAEAMGTDSGAARYYSPNNPEAATGFNKYIPDAEGYPFTEVEYTQDATGRVSRQSGVGPTYKIGGGHETKYYYGTPDQKELDALFGTEVGDVSHYFKNMVRDANGQYSISYTDMHGRTIATALAGTPDGVKLDKLTTNDTATAVETLSDPNSTTVLNNLVMQNQKTLLVSKSGMHTFNYQLNPQSLELADCKNVNVCYDCLYDLEITITDDCNNQKLNGKAFDTVIRNFSLNAIDTNCNNAAAGFSVSFQLFLQEGSYDITKKLSVSRYGMDYYRDSVFAKKNTCKTLEQFIQQQRQIILTQLLCEPTCGNCRAYLGNWETFRNNFMQKAGIAVADSAGYRDQAWASWEQAVADCDALCDKVSEYNDIRNAMLADMTPSSGQYATEAAADKYNIFYSHIDPDDNLPDTLPLFNRVTNYVDENGQADMVYDETVGKTVYPYELSAEAFAQKFKSSWTEALLPYHPEYCKLQQYEALKSSYEWDSRFEAVDTYQEAYEKGYLNPTNGNSILFTAQNGWTSGLHPDPDPIINSTSYSYQYYLQNQIEVYLSVANLGSFNMWQIAATTVSCINSNNTYNCYEQVKSLSGQEFNSLCTGDKDMAWRSFRELYLNMKRSIINARLNDAAVCGNNTPSATQLVAAGYTSNFSDATEMLAATGTALPNDATTASQQTQATISAYYADNCSAYVALWCQQLASCNYTTADTAVIMPLLRQVCMEGSDADHTMGASSVSPSSSNTYKSFEEVLRAYNQANNKTASGCNPYLITSPAPYDQQIAYASKTIYSKPDSCDCAQISKMYQKFKPFVPNYGYFSNYLQLYYNTTISEEDVTQLRNLCAGESASCNYLDHPIQLPSVLQCSAGDVCVDCIEYGKLDQEFRSLYPNVTLTISYDPFDSVQIANNKLYEQFMNYRLGFSKTAYEYLNFLNYSCAGATTCASGDDTITFIKMYGGDGIEDFLDLQSAPDGGFIMAGSTTSYGSGGKDGYIVKTDIAGNVQWSKAYGGESNDDFLKIRNTSDGGYVAIGNTASYSCTNYSPYIDSVAGLMVVKMNGTGVVQWSRYFDMEACDPWTQGKIPGGEVIQTADGGYAVLVNMSGQETCEGYSLGYGNWMLLRIDANGNELWSTMMHFQNQKGAYYTATLIEDNDGFLVAGGMGSEGSEGAPYQCSLVRIDKNNGNKLWDKTYYYNTLFAYTSKVKGIYQTAEGFRIEVLVYYGWFYQQGDHLIIDVDPQGNIIRTKNFLPPGLQYYQTRLMTPLSDDGYLSTEASTYFAWHKIDMSGNLIGNPFYTEGLNYDTLTRMVQHSDGSLAIAGIYAGEGLLYRIRPSFINTGETTDYQYGCITSYSTNDNYITDISPVVNENVSGGNSRGHSFNEMYLAGISATTAVIDFCSKDGCAVTTSMLCGNPGSLASVINDSITACSDSTLFITNKATEIYESYSDSLSNHFDSAYRAKCLQAYKYETFTVTHTANEYHYTLYYYDQAGNLLKTVPPEGVHPNRNAQWLEDVKQARAAGTTKVPDHTLITQYRYNTLNQVITQQSPDAGVSSFWYDRLGRLVVSQNAKQKAASATENNRLYSYTLYDALGRITEVGQIKNATATTITASISRVQASLATWVQNSVANKEQITQTVYDVAYTGFTGINPEPIVQHNLRNRVSYTSFTLSNNPAQYNQATFYTYDIHGSVDTLLQDYGNSSFVPNVMNSNNNRFKQTTYQYDLVSGKVNQVAYQPNQSDQLYHRYSYDAENRIILVETSLDSITWEKDARYTYYKHGPLARTVLGDQMVQGVDYAYTLQGWLKGVNSTSLKSDYDIGADAKSGGANQYVAKDALSFNLNYFAEDYKPIGFASNAANTPFPAYSAYLNTSYKPLYNGNISSMAVNIGKFNNPLLYNYTYDQLNRLSAMDAWNGLDESNNSWSSLIQTQEYQERVSYDANGNIKTYLRNGYGSNLAMDSLTYNYNVDAQGRLVNNQLNYVRDRVNNSTSHSGNYTTDIEDQAANNYQYDAIGNLIADSQEGITNIIWNVYGKIIEIQRTATSANPVSNIQYTYDAAGNRISKRVERSTGSVEYTWYVRDAQGNVMSTYASGNNDVNSGQLTQTEAYLYGSSRLAVCSLERNMQTPASVSQLYMFERGDKAYELANHLGNVLVTVNDKKLGVSSNNSTVDYFNPQVVCAQDYYPFGQLQSGRQHGIKGRYLFNGKEQDPEVKGEGAQYDYGFRIYDPRLGRFLSVDPLFKSYPWYTPYQFAGNMPIWAIDLDGLEEKKATIIKVVRIFDTKGNLIKEPTRVEYGATGNTILATPSATTVRQGDDGGDIIENRTDYRQVEGIKFTITEYSVHKSFSPEPGTKNNTIQTNDPPPTTGTEDVVSWRYGTRTSASPITETNTFARDLNVAFQKESGSNPGIGFVDRKAALASISSYADELKSNGVTSINITISSQYYNWDTKANNPAYTNASDLVAARAEVIKGLFTASGITVNRVNEQYNVTPAVSATASKSTTTVTGYNVTTTPIKQKLVNGKPAGRPTTAGRSTTTTSPTKPATGDKFRR